MVPCRYAGRGTSSSPKLRRFLYAHWWRHAPPKVLRNLPLPFVIRPLCDWQYPCFSHWVKTFRLTQVIKLDCLLVTVKSDLHRRFVANESLMSKSFAYWLPPHDFSSASAGQELRRRDRQMCPAKTWKPDIKLFGALLIWMYRMIDRQPHRNSERLDGFGDKASAEVRFKSLVGFYTFNCRGRPRTPLIQYAEDTAIFLYCAYMEVQGLFLVLT